MGDCEPPIQSDKYQCHIDTVSSHDDGHTDARNMYRRENKIKINILRNMCNRWLNLQMIIPGC